MYFVMFPFATAYDQTLYCHTLQQMKPELVNQIGTVAKSRIVMSPLAA